MIRKDNRKLLVSVFNAQEAREAVYGGARIIDSEDPKSALGNIKPLQIANIRDAVLHANQDALTIQLSTNIGENQQLYHRAENNIAVSKTPYEIAGKAAQAALGVACTMGNIVHPCDIVKVGVDGMKIDLLKDVLAEIVNTIKRTKQCQNDRIMSVLFAQDMMLWKRRSNEEMVKAALVDLGEYYSCDEKDPDALDLRKYVLSKLTNENGNLLYKDYNEISLDILKSKGLLQSTAEHFYVKLNPLYPHYIIYPGFSQVTKTTEDVIKLMVDATVEAGADSIMLDTSIQTKSANISLVDTGDGEFIDLNQYDVANNLPRAGILGLRELQFFVEYCHSKNIETNIAGSVQSYQAQQLWARIPDLDQIATRGGASALPIYSNQGMSHLLDTRQNRIIKRNLVRGFVPPEQGGVLNIPAIMKQNPKALVEIRALVGYLSGHRQKLKLPALEAYFVDDFGNAEPIY